MELVNNISIYTKDNSVRFDKKNGNLRFVGYSDLIACYNTDDRIVGIFKLPGLIDIKDLIFLDQYAIILSGLRDSVYILDKYLNQIVVVFNINKEGEIELFKDRQKQCNEIPSNYFQIFYCPAMNNYHHFYKLEIRDSILSILSHINHNVRIDLNTLAVIR